LVTLLALKTSRIYLSMCLSRLAKHRFLSRWVLQQVSIFHIFSSFLGIYILLLSWEIRCRLLILAVHLLEIHIGLLSKITGSHHHMVWTSLKLPRSLSELKMRRTKC
jgi:hypothetical protein